MIMKIKIYYKIDIHYIIKNDFDSLSNKEKLEYLDSNIDLNFYNN